MHRRPGMDGQVTVTGASTIDRARVEARARRLGAAVASAYVELQRTSRSGQDVERAWHELDDRVQDLSIIATLLPATHVVRLAAEHLRAVHARWTEDPEAERLPFVLALSLLERSLGDCERRVPQSA